MKATDKSSIKERASQILDSVETLLDLAGGGDEKTEKDARDTVTEKVIAPEEQLQAEIEALKNQIKVVELLRFEIAKMPGKEELIAAVLMHLPQENKRISADSPAITRRASDPYD